LENFETDVDLKFTIPIKEIHYSPLTDRSVPSIDLTGTSRDTINEGLNGHRRDKFLVMINIMELLDSGESRITNIIYKCNLNYKTASKVIDEMIKRGYIRTDTARGAKEYSITNVGTEALVNLRKYYAKT